MIVVANGWFNDVVDNGCWLVDNWLMMVDNDVVDHGKIMLMVGTDWLIVAC